MATPTQHGETDNTDIPAPSVWEVVDKALVGASVIQLGVVDEDGGTCTWHGGHEAHSTIEMVGKAEHLAALVNYHLHWGFGQRQKSKNQNIICSKDWVNVCKERREVWTFLDLSEWLFSRLFGQRCLKILQVANTEGPARGSHGSI